jgi:hypothetical protein
MHGNCSCSAAATKAAPETLGGVPRLRRRGTTSSRLLIDRSCVMTGQKSRIRKRVPRYCRVFDRGTMIGALRL